MKADDKAESRRRRLLAYLNGVLRGDRAELQRRLKPMTKGRITQLLHGPGPFGERAADNLTSRLRLPDGYFDADVATPTDAANPKGLAANPIGGVQPADNGDMATSVMVAGVLLTPDVVRVIQLYSELSGASKRELIAALEHARLHGGIFVWEPPEAPTPATKKGPKSKTP